MLMFKITKKYCLEFSSAGYLWWNVISTDTTNYLADTNVSEECSHSSGTNWLAKD